MRLNFILVVALLLLCARVFADDIQIGNWGITDKSRQKAWDGPFIPTSDFTKIIRIEFDDKDDVEMYYDSIDIWGFPYPDIIRPTMEEFIKEMDYSHLRKNGAKRIRLINYKKGEKRERINRINVTHALKDGYVYLVIIHDWQGTLKNGHGKVIEETP
jgi:hypothetical protein